jgi:flagellar basal-body rod modification protein FlgD
LLSSVSEVYSQASTGTSATEDNNVLGKDDFLTLLVAQLQNQDPLNPSDSTEFTAQLAQFSSLEQLQNVNDTLANFEVYQSTLNNIQSSGFIGKTITATGNLFGVTDSVAEPIRFELANDADSVYIQIYDKYGNFVNDIQFGAMEAGEQETAWDGRDTNGTEVADGSYTFTIMAMNADGSVIESTSYTTGTVTGIDYKSGATNLLINGNEIPVASVIRVEESGATTENE